MATNFQRLPDELYTCVGLLEHIQENWYLCPEVRQSLDRLVSSLNPIAAKAAVGKPEADLCKAMLSALHFMNDHLNTVNLDEGNNKQILLRKFDLLVVDGILQYRDDQDFADYRRALVLHDPE